MKVKLLIMTMTILLGEITGGTLWPSMSASACTGISLTSADGCYIQARTIENATLPLPSHWIVIPRGHKIQSFTPTGRNGLAFEAKYGVLGLTVVREEFIAEGINEEGLSAGLFFFPDYGSYQSYEPSQNAHTLGDLQVVAWILASFSTIDQVKQAVDGVRIVGLDKSAVVHWRIGERTGRQVVMEIIRGVVHFHENTVGVITNSPDFKWHLTNLNNYVNLYPGAAPDHKLSKQPLHPIGGNSGYLGLPGDATPPSRFVRAAFYCASAPVQPTGEKTILQAFHLLNNFDVPIGIEHPIGKAPDMPSATQWTSAIDLTRRKVYYKTAYNNTIRCIDLAKIDFGRVGYQSHPLDNEQHQPIKYLLIE